MPNYFVVAGARSLLNGNMMELLSTLGPHRMATYHWDKPIGAFLWPMDSMQRLPGQRELSRVGLRAWLVDMVTMAAK